MSSEEKILLILGAGEDQAPLYVEARALGYTIIGVDQKQKEQSIAACLADRYYAISTRDAESIVQKLGAIHLAGILAPASDAAQETLYKLSQFYRTPYCPSPEAVQASNDKASFRAMLRRFHLPCYWYIQSNNPAELVQKAQQARFPLVVKPSDASGSKGIRVVQQPEQLVESIAYAQTFSFSGNVIIEEYITGRHYSAEVFFKDKQLHFVAISEKMLAPFPSLLTQAHLLPAQLEKIHEEMVLTTLQEISQHLHITQGPLNCDFIFTPQGQLYFVEMGARLGGNGMPQLVQRAFGVNTSRATLRLALGLPFELTPSNQNINLLSNTQTLLDEKCIQQASHNVLCQNTHWSKKVLLYILSSAYTQPGVLRRIEGVDQVLAHPLVEQLHIFVQLGEVVRPFTQSAHKLGYLIISGDTYTDIEKTLQFALHTLQFDIAIPSSGVTYATTEKK